MAIVADQKTVFAVLSKYWKEQPVDPADERTLRSAESIGLVSFSPCGSRVKLTPSGKHLLALGSGSSQPIA
jgi:hypothetical protein